MVPSIQPPLRQQSTRSTRSTSAADWSNTKIQLRNGKQLPLPPWMTCHHLPEYGIASSGASSSSVLLLANNKEAQKTTSRSIKNEVEETSRTRSTRWQSSTRRSNNPSASAAGDMTSSNTNTNTFTAPQVSASNYKSKKGVALDSLYPPTKQEVLGHIRYLSEEAMKLAMKEIDGCIAHCLRYSSTINKENLLVEGGNKAIPNNGLTMKKKDNLSYLTLATEIHNYFDMFQPDANEEEDHEEDTTSSLKIMEEGTEAGGDIQRQDILHDMLPQKYGPTVLPMITIKCYPNVLDRIEMTNGLLLDLPKSRNSCNPNSQTPQHHNQQRGAEDEKSTCVCVIRSTSELVQQGHIMTEVLSQCISNDPNGEAFAMELQRQRKRQKSHHHGGANNGVLVRSIWSWTQSLVEWAGFTEAFDSIIVILEVSASLCSFINYHIHT